MSKLADAIFFSLLMVAFLVTSGNPSIIDGLAKIANGCAP